MENRCSFRLALCDSDKKLLDTLEKTIFSLTQSSEYQCSIKKYTNGALLLKEEAPDVVFTEVALPEMNGFLMAKSLKRNNERCRIIFLTSHKEYIQQAFKVGAYRYLYKPHREEEIKEALDSVYAVRSKKEGLIVSDRDKNIKSFVLFCDIYSLESIGDYTALHTKSGVVVTNTTLRMWKKQLGQSFIQCHKSHIVNLFWVHAVSNESIWLQTGQKIPVSVRSRAGVKRAFHEYVQGDTDGIYKAEATLF